MSINLHILNASGRLNDTSDQIEKEFHCAVDKISKTIPLSDTDIVIYDNPHGIIPELGIGGYTPSPHLVFIYIDPGFPNLSNMLSETFKRTLAHEMYHALRWKNPGYGKTLLEALITEGLADHFDIEVFGQLPHPWSRAVLYKEKKSLIDLVKKEYNNKCDRKVYKEWFLGWGSRGIPRWSGYTVGFEIVKKYLKTYKKSKPSTLYNKDTKDFIDALKSL